MTVGDIPTAANDRKISTTFNFDEFSRTLIAVAQMVGDGLVLTSLVVCLVAIRYIYRGSRDWISF